MLKVLAKRALRSIVAGLPWGARQAVLEGILDHGDRDGAIMGRLAKRSGIVAVVADGDFGWISSIPSDSMVLARYARTGTFSRTNNIFFESFFGTEPGRYLDIGANIGMTLLPIARSRQIECWAFEADPSNFKNLRDNVHRHITHGNVTLQQIALYDRRTTLKFGLAADGNPGDHRIIARESQRVVIEVAAAPLDDLVPVYSGRLAAKIDVQGAESFVIAGGQRTLGQAGAVTIELSPYHISQLDGDIDVILDYLSKFDRIAMVEGDSDEGPVFEPSSQAIGSLRTFYQKGREEAMKVLHLPHPPHQRFLDVYALRGPTG